MTLALVTGLSFTFMAAVMPNLAGVDDHTFVTITQRFNANPVFPLTFTLALLLLIGSVVVQAWQHRGPVLRWLVVALALYLVVLAITGGLHIPLNEQIDAAGDPDRHHDLARVREQFETPWVVGNVVRTLVCAAALAAMARALHLHGRATAHR